MASLLHFVLIPFPSPGPIIPMVDIAKILAERNAIVTILTTPLNASRSLININRSVESGLPIHVKVFQFPTGEFGLPQGSESADLVPSKDSLRNFIKATEMLQETVEKLIGELQVSPDCIIADKHFSWIANLASRLGVPRVSFDGMNCIYHLCSQKLRASKILETVSETEPFVVPGLPDHIELTKAQIPSSVKSTPSSYLHEFFRRIIAAQENTYGVLINSFDELEQDYVKEFKKVKGGSKVWCVGPVSLSNNDIDKAQRGRKPAIDENLCLKWLDSQLSSSVIYACLGSISQVNPAQLIELGLALESSNRPFIWVLRAGNEKDELEQWLEENKYEERLKGRGFLIKGWSPQVLILSHPAIGGFITHCGWNSTLEAISAGVPMITWPLSGELFINEKLVEQVLKIGVKVGSEVAVHVFDEENYVREIVKRERIEEAIGRLMDEGKESEERRERARKLGEMAKKAVEEGGSFFLNMSLLIEDIKLQSRVDHKKILP